MIPLPTELLCKIFLELLSDSPFDENPYGEEDEDVEMLDGSPQMVAPLTLPKPPFGENGHNTEMAGRSLNLITPFTLSAICRKWRYTAHGDPRLWNFVYLVAVPGKVLQRACLLEQWLSRAGALPLTIEIDCPGDRYRRWSADYREKSRTLLLPIFRYDAQIATFRTRLPLSCLPLPHPSDNIPPPRFTHLTELTIVPQLSGTDDDDDEDEDGEPLGVTTLFRHALKLQQVKISDINVKQLDIPWKNVTEVTTKHLSLGDCIRILRLAAPRLVYCAFEDILYQMRDPNPGHIFLPRLRLLHLDFGQVGVARDLITSIITAPELKTFEYFTQEDDTFPAQYFVSFIERSECVLTDLTIEKPSMDVAHLYACLARVAQSLECLSLELTSNDEEDFLIQFRPTRQALATNFPRLQRLQFTAPSQIINAFSDMLNQQ